MQKVKHKELFYRLKHRKENLTKIWREKKLIVRDTDSTDTITLAGAS